MSRQDYSDYEHHAPRFEQHEHWQQQQQPSLNHYDREQFVPRQPPPQPAYSAPPTSNGGSTLYWGDLEAWMDQIYVQSVVTLMKWEATVRVPNPGPDATANNPGYCFLTFPSPAHAAAVLAQMSTTAATMPNSAKQFNLKWASAVPASASGTSVPTSPPSTAPQPAFPKEYSIFVGDLAPEASNSDLVAVFRNPVLGLRNDREPKFIRPFLSCKSAKIMLDPVTGVSRGYGFVRFTDEADQQRALIEMHGLYCLSRPMRISPATAKFKPQPSYDLPQVQMPAHLSPSSGPGMGSFSSPSLPSLASAGSTNSSASLASLSDIDLAGVPPGVLAHLAHLAGANNNGKPPASHSHPSRPQSQSVSYVPSDAARYGMTEESWKHQAQARAILSNLIGPNGEQLTSTDPYNTTVFVGGLSPLIAEDTLRSFFVPFGEIHYVKVPVGKNCGFVQFVHKADAERAIESMQGFPIGGSRIRLSWGRSQYKAAQAAAQAAQAAVAPPPPPPAAPAGITPEQAAHLLSRFGLGQPQKEDPQNRRLSEEGVRALIMAQGRGGNHQSNGSGSSAGAGAYGNGSSTATYGNGGVGSYTSNGSASYGGNGAGAYDMYASASAEQESPELARARKRAFSPFAPESTPTGSNFLDHRRGSEASMLPMLKSNATGANAYSLGGFGAAGDYAPGSGSRDIGASAREFATNGGSREFSSGVGSVPRELTLGTGARDYGASSAPRDFAPTIGSAPRDLAPGSISPGSLARPPRFEPQASGAVSRPSSSFVPPEAVKFDGSQRTSPPAPAKSEDSVFQDLNGTLASLTLGFEDGKSA